MSSSTEPWGDISVYGLGVMGDNLIMNIAEKGFKVVVANRTKEKIDPMIERARTSQFAQVDNLRGGYSPQEVAALLKKPRKIILLVKAGSAVDSTMEEFAKYFEKGDILIDGGNSLYTDSIRRTKEIEAKGLYFVGCGVSGGEVGARYGPSLMPGGSEAAYPALKPILETIAAQHTENGKTEPCCAWMGATGAGHFVKMVHNGIEYGDMQIIAEAYDIMRRGFGMSVPEIADVFYKWNTDVLDSFLIKITADILKVPALNQQANEWFIDDVDDKAGQKGTGKWTAVASLETGMPLTLIGEAVFARFLSSLQGEREQASKFLNAAILPAEKPTGEKLQQFVEDLKQAVYSAKIISYAQGFMLMKEAAKEQKWVLQYDKIAAIWRQGCIIKSVFLNDITRAYVKNPELESLLFDDFFANALASAQGGWRATMGRAIMGGIPTPALSSALAFFDGYRTPYLPTSLIQAQRDNFGAHTFGIRKGRESQKFPLQTAKGEAAAYHLDWENITKSLEAAGNKPKSAYS